MPEILTKSPATGETGLDTETVNFETLPRVAVLIPCPTMGRYMPASRPTLGSGRATAGKSTEFNRNTDRCRG